jgi:hypothetical protein
MPHDSLIPLPSYQPIPKTALPSLSQQMAWVAGILFLVITTLLFFLGKSPSWQNLIGNIAINFLAMMVEALPFMLIGSLAGGLIEVFVPVDWVDRTFRQHRLRAVFIAGGMGLFFPVCECAIVPVIRRLLGKGVPFAAAITFLLAGPIVNTIVAASTAIAYSYDWRVVAIRLGCGYCIAVIIGLLLGRWFNRENGLVEEVRHLPSCECGHEHCGHEFVTAAWPVRVRHALVHASDDFFGVGFYLVIGTFIAAFVRSVVSMDTFSYFLAMPWQAILIMMAMALLLNLCSEADAFIAASFRGLLPASAQMAFMVLGPMLDIKLLLMYFGVFRKRVIVALVVTVLVVVLTTMLGLQYFWPDWS